jgi:hypothetical protein
MLTDYPPRPDRGQGVSVMPGLGLESQPGGGLRSNHSQEGPHIGPAKHLAEEKPVPVRSWLTYP